MDCGFCEIKIRSVVVKVLACTYRRICIKNGEIFTCTHTYIISHYNSLVNMTTQHLTPLMLCLLILYVSEEHLSRLRMTSFLKNFSYKFNSLPEFCYKSAFFHISLYWRYLTWCLNYGLTLNTSPAEPLRLQISISDYYIIK